MAGGLNCCEALCKHSLCWLSCVFMLLGLAMVALPIYVLGRAGDLASLASDGFHSIPMLLVVLGCIVTVVFFCGCMGFRYQNGCMVLTFALVLGIILVMELVAGISAYMLRDQSSVIFENTLNSSFQHYADKNQSTAEMWDTIQKDLKCCGLNKTDDYITQLHMDTPVSCCIKENCTTSDTSQIFDIPCEPEIRRVLNENITLAAKWAIGIACFHLFWVISACYMGFVFRNRGSYEHV